MDIFKKIFCVLLPSLYVLTSSAHALCCEAGTFDQYTVYVLTYCYLVYFIIIDNYSCFMIE